MAKNWYIIHTYSGFEKKVAETLRSRIEAERPDDQLRRPLSAAAPDEGAEPCQELGERERFRQIVVRPGVEAGDAVFDSIARGQHEDRRPHTGIPKLAARLETADPREHDVEHDRLVGVRLRHPDGVLARRGQPPRPSPSP